MTDLSFAGVAVDVVTWIGLVGGFIGIFIICAVAWLWLFKWTWKS
jgi:hypothetical protein